MRWVPLFALFTLPSGCTAAAIVRLGHREEYANEPLFWQSLAVRPELERDAPALPPQPPCNIDQGAEATAIGLIFAVVVVPVILYMALTPGETSDLTLKLVDTSISIFLALLWYSAISALLEYHVVYSMFPYAEEVFSLFAVFVLYSAVLTVAYYWRDKEVRLMTLGGCGAHYIAFAGIHATGETHYEFVRTVGEENGVWLVWLCCGVGLAFLLALFKVTHVCCIEPGHHAYEKVVEDIELDVVGLTVSFALTQAIRHAITGHYPPSAHLLLTAQRWGPTYNASPRLAPHAAEVLLAGSFSSGPQVANHQPWQKLLMLMWSMFLTCLAVLWLFYLNRHGEFSGRHARKTARVLTVLLVMCIAWGYLLLGEWIFLEDLFEGHPLVGMMCFAVLTTMASLVLIVFLASLKLERRGAQKMSYFCVLGASLIASWSWEHTFDSALNVIAKNYEVGYAGLVPKTILAFLIPVAVLPVYVTYIKPRVMQADVRVEQVMGLPPGSEVSDGRSGRSSLFSARGGSPFSATGGSPSSQQRSSPASRHQDNSP